MKVFKAYHAKIGNKILPERLSRSKSQVDNKVNLDNYLEGGEYLARPVELEADFTLWATQESDFTMEIDETHPNLFAWWRENEHIYPIWAAMAYDYQRCQPRLKESLAGNLQPEILSD